MHCIPGGTYLAYAKAKRITIIPHLASFILFKAGQVRTVFFSAARFQFQGIPIGNVSHCVIELLMKHLYGNLLSSTAIIC